MGAVAVLEGAVGIAVEIEQIDTREKFAAVITDRFNRIYRDVVEIGALLADARLRLSYHEFQRLIEHELPFGRTTTYAYLREWTLFEAGKVRTSEQLSDSYRTRIEIDRLVPDEISRGIAEGRLYPGVPTAKVIAFRKEVRTEHQHRPESNKCPAPARPEGAGARSYSELVYLLVEWRKSLGHSQAALDQIIAWGEGQASHYEIPHQDDGKIFTLRRTLADGSGRTIDGTIFDYLAGLGLGIQLVPLA